MPTFLFKSAALTLPLLPAVVFAWTAYLYKLGLIRPGFSKRLKSALIVILGVATAVVAHWNYDWYATLSDQHRHVLLLAALAVALMLAFSLLLEPVWAGSRRTLLSLHVLTLVAFGGVVLGAVDPARIAVFDYALFTYFLTTLVALGEIGMIWRIATWRDRSAGYDA